MQRVYSPIIEEPRPSVHVRSTKRMGTFPLKTE